MRTVSIFFAACALSGAALCGETLSFADIAGKSRLDVPELAPCTVTGVVTFLTTSLENSGIVASPGDLNGYGIWFSGEVNARVVAETEGMERLETGMLVEIEGVVSRLGFAPGIKAGRIRYLGRKVPFEKPPEYRLRDFDWGVLDNRRASIRGVLMDARVDAVKGFSRLTFATPDGDFIAHVPGAPYKWRGAVDSEIAVSGVALSLFNIRGEYLGLQMVARDADEDLFLYTPGVPADKAPYATLDNILPYSGKPADRHRRRVRGVATFVKQGSVMYLQSVDGALRVRTGATGFRPGDEVEAVGFPMIENGIGLLAFAEVKKVGEAPVPEAAKVGWAELTDYPVNEDGTYKNFDAKRVVMECRLLTVDDSLLIVDVGGVRVSVEMGAPLPPETARYAAAKPLLRLVGVLSILQDTSAPNARMPSIAGWRLQVDGPDGVELVPDQALSRYKTRLLATRAFLATGAFAVVCTLYLFFRFLRSRADYKKLQILTQERKRMAGDLHDTIEQSLVSAKMLLQTSVSLSPDTPQNVREAVAMVQELLMSTKAQIRETVFNLRSDELFKRKPSEVLKSFAERLSRGGYVKVRTMLRALPEKLHEALFSDILLIVQESVTNAVKHGKAKTVFVVSDPCEGGFVLRIANDGAPFDPAKALGPEAGHFGLSGMAERARRNGIGFSILEEDGMPTVRLEVKL